MVNALSFLILVGVTIDMLKQLAPQVRLPPQQAQLRKPSEPEEKEWPSLAKEAKSIPLHQPGQEAHSNWQGGAVMESGKQEWTQTNPRKSWNPRQKKSWNQTGKKSDTGGGRKDVWNQGANTQGSNVSGPFAPLHMGGNVQPLFPPGIDVRANFQPSNYGSQASQVEATSMGMWNRPRPSLDMASLRMGSNSGTGSNPHEMNYGQHRWGGYEGLSSNQEQFRPLLQAPNAPIPLIAEPRPFAALMPHPPMQGSYVYPAPVANYHGGAVDSEQVQRSKSSEVDSKRLRGSEHTGHLAYPAVSHPHSAGLAPHSHSSGGVSISHAAGVVSRSHSSSSALYALSQQQTSGAMSRSHSTSTLSHPHSAVAGSHSHAVEESGENDVRGKLILLRGLPGSGKTCLAKCVRV